jgi:hypothetical protein
MVSCVGADGGLAAEIGGGVAAVPWWVWVLVVVEVGLILAAVVRELRTSATAVGVEGRAALRLAVVFAAGYVGWVLVTAALAGAHVYRFESNATKPWLALGLAVPVVGLLLLSRLPVARRILSDQQILSRLTRPHGVRVGGLIFLIALALGELPAAFALPAGLGDIAIGLAAPWVARGLRDGNGTRRAFWFNVAGLVDFAVAFSIGFLAGPGRTQLLHVSPTTEQISVLPLVLIPTAGVPLLFVLHVIALVKLRGRPRGSAAPAPREPAGAGIGSGRE